MRVLVTGAAGYVGRVVVQRLLSLGHQPIGLTHQTIPDIEGVLWHHGDILATRSLRDAVEDVDAVVHLAALSGVRDAFAQPTSCYQVNVGGTLNLLEALAERPAPPCRFVFASTAGVYGVPVRQPVCESAPPAPQNPYAASKLAAEEAVRWQAATGKLGAVTLRLGNVAGAVGIHRDTDETRIIARACAVAAGRIPRLDVYGDGGSVRDFVHVMDAANAFVAALDACLPGHHRSINIGSTPASVAEIVVTAREITDHDIPVVHHAAHPGEVRELRVDISRARELLGWRPQHSELPQLVNDQWGAEQMSTCSR